MPIANSERLLRTSISMNKSLYSYNKYIYVLTKSLMNQYQFMGRIDTVIKPIGDLLPLQQIYFLLNSYGRHDY